MNKSAISPTLAALVVIGLTSCAPPAPAPAPPEIPRDGKTDATALIQQKLDEQGATGGDVVLPPGQYLIAGSLHVPKAVRLKGSWEMPHHGSEWSKGTTLLITGGRGEEHGPSSIQLEADSAVDGITMLWPEQTAHDIQPYPWAIEAHDQHPTIENVTLVNAYQGLWVGSKNGSLHLVRNVYGCVLRRGVFVDATTDIGRIENVHFNPHYWLGSGHPSVTYGIDPKNKDEIKQVREQVATFLGNNLDAFIFGRSDWEYMVDTFVWGAKNGYLFIKTPHGACNGQFLGIGADFCRACVRVSSIQPIGLQITNGEFTAFAGDPNSAIVTDPGADGAAQFVNCNFWGVRGHVLWMQGRTQVTLADCHILDSLPAGAVLAEHGKLIVQACNFEKPCPAVILQPGVSAAVVMGNLQTGGVRIENGIGALAQIGFNEGGASSDSHSRAPAPAMTPASNNP